MSVDHLNRHGLAMIEPPLEIDMLREYWRDPAPFEAEVAANRAQFNAAMAPHDARVRAQREARWAREAA